MPFPEKDSPQSPPLISDSLLKGLFYTNGAQLAVVLPSGVTPNPLRRKSCCRLFSLIDGTHIADVCVDNPHNAMTMCFDSVNELVWANAPDNWHIARWAHHGTQAVKREKIGDVTTQESAALSILDSLRSISSKVFYFLDCKKFSFFLFLLIMQIAPCRRIRITASSPFAIDVSRANFEQLSTFLRLAIVRFEERNKSYGGTHRTVLLDTLHLLRAQVYHAAQLPEPAVLADLASPLASIKAQLVALLASLQPEDPLVPAIHELLLVGLKAFYATPALQVLWAMDLLRAATAQTEGAPPSSATRTLLNRLFHKFAEQSLLFPHFWPSSGEVR